MHLAEVADTCLILNCLLLVIIFSPQKKEASKLVIDQYLGIYRVNWVFSDYSSFLEYMRLFEMDVRLHCSSS